MKINVKKLMITGLAGLVGLTLACSRQKDLVKPRDENPLRYLSTEYAVMARDGRIVERYSIKDTIPVDLMGYRPTGVVVDKYGKIVYR